ncbi:MAG TPA: TauD/TfdA family dioxygenase, partial [Thermomicrobiales bacterium]|nr:TauD/TfdA family dioxygenase [Thermomicrobiales bacterium]
DLAAELVKPWYRDRRNEIPPGKAPWFELPVFMFARGYFSASWQNYYIRSAQRFPELPRFTKAQQEALDMVDAIADEVHLDMAFEPGDVQLLHNHVIVHSRTAYDDWPEPERRRHLLRLWLATPGGRPLPDAFLDRYVGLKPGQRPAGIVVEDMSLNVPLTPE